MKTTTFSEIRKCIVCDKEYSITRRDLNRVTCSRMCKRGLTYEQLYGSERAETVRDSLRIASINAHKNMSLKVKNIRKQKISKTLMNHPVSTETRLKIGIKSAELMKNIEYKNRVIKKSLLSGCKRPNNFETNALNYLNSISKYKFKYTGNGSLMINGRSADAYSKETNTVALFHGVYWHLEKNGLKITEENKRSVEKVDTLPFADAGCKVIFIWEDELNRMISRINA